MYGKVVFFEIVRLWRRGIRGRWGVSYWAYWICVFLDVFLEGRILGVVGFRVRS